ncbi:P-loop containing nucleoside triphosphate hydrolase protein [Pseudovirgaria hyperparasitica]|uniref:P-loop containing nucleoside triphosphate hydrolase protein n=1 Tax=Pseudovirgaria hyperparasitica TaxID=470096 RepID=A0A6A6W9T1_9PEZI|nr:P-loop containing nucleoside triphosphate hydrolase protein [Pseudovirgaria hyperparasitica]KAF2759433.1 P-loop containing nucleoside triphosphate hydrolase protein [Pseudovirgaria hyperparasitica]
MVVQVSACKVLNLLLPQIQHKVASDPSQPVFIGVSGLQGSGKSTWAHAIVALLSTEHNLNAITVSLDDFYLTHAQLIRLRDENPENRLFRTRGQPGTHDEQLASRFFDAMKGGRKGTEPVRIPMFDKSRFDGEGDRVPEEQWPVVESAVQVVVFEGWCVGFQPISEDDLSMKLKEASESPVSLTNTLPMHHIEHLLELNRNLTRYCRSFMGPDSFDCFIHLDTEKLENVYMWRSQQEHTLIQTKGTGMGDEQVEEFIQGYMPSYEMYLGRLRKGLFVGKENGEGRHVRVVFGKEREILDMQVL